MWYRRPPPRRQSRAHCRRRHPRLMQVRLQAPALQVGGGGPCQIHAPGQGTYQSHRPYIECVYAYYHRYTVWVSIESLLYETLLVHQASAYMTLAGLPQAPPAPALHAARRFCLIWRKSPTRRGVRRSPSTQTTRFTLLNHAQNETTARYSPSPSTRILG